MKIISLIFPIYGKLNNLSNHQNHKSVQKEFHNLTRKLYLTEIYIYHGIVRIFNIRLHKPLEFRTTKCLYILK